MATGLTTLLSHLFAKVNAVASGTPRLLAVRLNEDGIWWRGNNWQHRNDVQALYRDVVPVSLRRRQSHQGPVQITLVLQLRAAYDTVFAPIGEVEKVSCVTVGGGVVGDRVTVKLLSSCTPATELLQQKDPRQPMFYIMGYDKDAGRVDMMVQPTVEFLSDQVDILFEHNNDNGDRGRLFEVEVLHTAPSEQGAGQWLLKVDITQSSRRYNR